MLQHRLEDGEGDQWLGLLSNGGLQIENKSSQHRFRGEEERIRENERMSQGEERKFAAPISPLHLQHRKTGNLENWKDFPLASCSTAA